jgi:hypothetical protein
LRVMKNGGHRQRIYIAVLLILLSVFFYVLSYALFHDARNVVFYLIQDIAFVFVQILLVTVILEQLLSEREKRSMFKKLNMVIGAFFSEAGTDMLKSFTAFESDPAWTSKHLIVDGKWSSGQFEAVRKVIEERKCAIDCQAGDLAGLKQLMVGKRQFLLGLLENPNLLEHESFTELLWSVFHLVEELSYRKSLEGLPGSDREHLAGDIKRAYILLIREWLSYMEHLKTDYPYLFSLAVRTNPFDPDARVEVR